MEEKKEFGYLLMQEPIRSIMDNSLQGYAISVEGQLVYANRSFCEIYGYSMEEMLSFSYENLESLIHPDDREKVVERYNERLTGKYIHPNYQLRILRKDGTMRWLEAMVTLQNWNGKPSMYMAAIDITDLKQTEQESKTINERLRLAQESNNAGTWDWIITENTFYWSPEFLKIFGMGPETTPGFEAWAKAVHPDDVELASKRIQEAIDERKKLVNDYRIVLQSGEIRWIRAVGNTFYQEQQPLRMIGLCIDITERKDIEKELKLEMARLELLNSHMVDREIRMVELKREIEKLRSRVDRDDRDGRDGRDGRDEVMTNDE